MLIDRNSRNFSFPAQIGILLGLIGAGLIVGSLLSMLVWLTMTHNSFLSMQTDMFKPENYYALMTIQGVSTLFMFFLPVVFFAMICYRSASRFIGFDTRVSYKQVMWVIALLILVFPLGGALAELNKILPIPADWAKKFKAMEEARHVQEAVLININSFPKYLMSMFIIAILPAIFEEVCFRAGLQNILTRWFGGPLFAILLTSIIFSAIHLSYYGFLVRFALGVILGMVFYISGSIWLSILFHFLFNGIQVTVMYAFGTNPDTNTKDIEQYFTLFWGPVALILLFIVFKRFIKATKEVQEKFVYKDPGDPNDFHNWITNN